MSFSGEFVSGDLEAAIHNYNMQVTGYRQSDGTWILNCTMTDVYDYTEFVLPDEERYKDNPTIWIPNDAAYLSQKSGAIVPYNVTISFTIKIK